MIVRRLRALLMIVLCASAASARAASPGVPAWQGKLSLASVAPSALGGEVGLALFFHPFEGRKILVGPRLGVLVAGGNGRTRFDLGTGLEASYWVANAVGSGLALDRLAPSTITGEDSATHYRVEPFVSARVMRFAKEGAWGLRLGVPYDTHYKWGVLVGVTLQLSGIPEIGE